jgi:polyisoprenyl-phosphate glycosyltransferase
MDDREAARDGRTLLSAVIACHGDALAVPLMHQRLTSVFIELGVDHEIIFVNDGSPDNAREVLAELASRDPHVVVVNHTRAFGSQSAFTSGMRVATGDAVVLLDGDLQDPPEIIPDMVEKWRAGYEVVYGERVDREAPGRMRLAYKLFYRAFRKASYVDVPVDAGDFGLLDRRVVDVLNALPEKQRFLRGLRAWAGFRQIGVPYVRPERMFGRSTNSFVKNLGWARKAILSLSYAPLDFMAWLAFVTVGLSMAAMVIQVVLRVAFPSAAPKGVTTLLLVILFIGGVQFLCFSILGSYLAHIYEEVKARPSYIVDEVLNHPATRSPAPGEVAATPSDCSAGAETTPSPAVAAVRNGSRPQALVTGAAGFVGANLVRRLLADGHRVTALVRPGTVAWRLDTIRDDVEVLEVDLLDDAALRRTVMAQSPEWVFHLAAHGAYSWQTDAKRIVETNLSATVSLVEACRDAGCGAFVYAGSSSEYGVKDHAPSESEALEPNSDYALSKASATMYCRHVAKRDNFKAISLRLYSVYGPFEDPRRLIPKLVSTGLRGELPPLVQANTARDFVAADDAVQAFLSAAALDTTEFGAIYNVGTGVQTSIREVVDVARRLLDVRQEPDWASMPPRIWDSDTWVADSTKIRSELSWRPTVSLEEGLSGMVDWLRANPAVWDLYGVEPSRSPSLTVPITGDRARRAD